MVSRVAQEGTGNTVRPELVEGLSFSLVAEKEGQGFDKLSPNGFGTVGVGFGVR